MAIGRSILEGGGTPIQTAAILNEEARRVVRGNEGSSTPDVTNVRAPDTAPPNVQPQNGGLGMTKNPNFASLNTASPRTAEQDLISNAINTFEQLRGSEPTPDGQRVVSPEGLTAQAPQAPRERPTDKIPNKDSHWTEKLAWVLRSAVAAGTGQELPGDVLRDREAEELDRQQKELTMSINRADMTIKLFPVIADAISSAPPGEQEAIAFDWANRVSGVFPNQNPEAIAMTFMSLGQQNVDNMKARFLTVARSGSPEVVEAAALAVAARDWESLDKAYEGVVALMGEEAEFITLRHKGTGEAISTTRDKARRIIDASPLEWLLTSNAPFEETRSPEEIAKQEGMIAEARLRAEKIVEAEFEKDDLQIDMSQTEARNLLFYTRARFSQDALTKVMEDGRTVDTLLADFHPFARTVFGRKAGDPEVQNAHNAAINFLLAIIRPDTGAAVTAEEFDLYSPNFFPQLGDPIEVILRKQAARENALLALYYGTGDGQIIINRLYGSPEVQPAQISGTGNVNDPLR
jgi:hypothetical protein